MKYKALGLAAGLTVAAVSQSVFAQSSTLDDRFYVAPMATYNFISEDSFDPDDNIGVQLNIGKTLTNWLAMEVYGFYFNDSDTDPYGSSSNVDIWGYGLDALLFPARQILPVYGIVGGGLGKFDFDQRSSGPAGLNEQNSRFFDVGAGIMIPLTDYGIALRAEYRYRTTNVDAPSSNATYEPRSNVVSLGLQIPLGAKPQPVAAPAPAAPAPRPSQPKDSDGDGVINPWDECPDTPANSAVDSNGCAVQSGEKAPVVLRGVLFNFDSAKLTTQAEGRLDQIGDKLSNSQSGRIDVNGYTDSIGPKAYNQQLSDKRAHSVKSYLIQHGVDADRLHAQGFGEKRPVAPNTKPDGSDNPEGRALNRRVEIHESD